MTSYVRNLTDASVLRAAVTPSKLRVLRSTGAVMDTLTHTAWDCYNMGKYAEAEQLLLQALKAREQQLGKEHRKLIPILNYIGILYVSQKRSVEAEGSFLRALHIAARKPKILGSEIDVMRNYAALLQAEKRVEEAQQIEACLEEARTKQKLTGMLNLTRNLSSSRNLSRMRRVMDDTESRLSKETIVRAAILLVIVACCTLWLLWQHRV